MRAALLAIILLLGAPLPSRAEPLSSRLFHLYWGLGPNFGLLGNVRVGISQVEFGILQGAGFGAVFVQRTTSPAFFQLGVLSTSGGGGVIGGGGMEWNTSSFFRLRSDITVSFDSAYQTQGFVSIGGVLIL